MPIDNWTTTALRSSNDWKLLPGMTINGGVPVSAQGLFAASAVTLTNGTSAQAIFSSAADSLAVEAKTTYYVNGLIRFTTGATSHTTSLTLTGLASSATFTTVALVVSAIGGDGSTLADLDSKVMEVGTATVVTAAGTGVRTILKIEGIIIVNAAGNISPQVTFSADPTGALTTDAGSFFFVSKIGKSTAVGTGLYS